MNKQKQCRRSYGTQDQYGSPEAPPVQDEYGSPQAAPVTQAPGAGAAGSVGTQGFYYYYYPVASRCGHRLNFYMFTILIWNKVFAKKY